MRIKIKQVFVPIIFLCILFNSGHVFQTLYPNVSKLLLFGCLILLLPLLRNILKKKKNMFQVSILISIGIVCATFVVHLGTGWYMYWSFFVMILFAYAVVCTYDFYDFIVIFNKVMLFVAFVGIIGYYLVNVHNALTFLPKMSSYNGFEYGVAGIFNYIILYPDRNCGLFWEPGLFATYLSIAMIFELLFLKKTNYFRIVVFVIAIITANSSAGFSLLFLIAIICIVRNKRNNSNIINKKFMVVKEILSGVVFFVGIIVALNFDLIILSSGLADNEYVQKLLLENVLESTRYKAIGHNISVFVSDPFFGAGFSQVVHEMRYVADNSTYTYLLSVFGIAAVLYVLVWLIGIFKLNQFNIYTRILLVVIVTVILNKEPHIQLVFSWIMFYYLIYSMSSSKRMQLEEV